eukprot:2393465-Pleurochrysis_carterae.AAC.1
MRRSDPRASRAARARRSQRSSPWARTPPASTASGRSFSPQASDARRLRKSAVKVVEKRCENGVNVV